MRNFKKIILGAFILALLSVSTVYADRTFSLPDPTGHGGDVLTTDGTEISWGAGGGGGTIGGTIQVQQVGYGSALNTLTSSANFNFITGDGLGRLVVGSANFWQIPNGLNPADLWIGESAGNIAQTSIDGRNTGVGYYVGSSMTTGSDNSFFGQASGYANTIGDRNAFFGSSSGRFNADGSENTFTGEEAGYTNVSGVDNTFTGFKSGYVSTGSYNVNIGAFTGVINTGDRNTFIGTGADGSVAARSQSIALGNAAKTTADNQFVVGSSIAPIDTMILGKGDTHATPTDVTLRINDSSGTNVVGKNLTIQAGIGTGTGDGGNILFNTALDDVSGSSLNTVSTWGRITGAGDVRFGDLGIVQNGTTFSVFDSGKTIEMSGQNINYGAVSFVGAGLDDMTYNQYFDGIASTVYTVTAYNRVDMAYNTLSGGTLTNGDLIIGIITGCAGDLISFNGTNIIVKVTSGDCTGESAFSDNTSGASALVSLVTPLADVFDWTAVGGNPGSASSVVMTGGAQSLTASLTITFGATTGHTIGDEWTINVTVSVTNKLRFDNQFQTYSFGDVDDLFNGTVFTLNDSTANQTAYLRADTQFQIDAGQVYMNSGQRDHYVYAGANTNRNILVTDYKVGMNPAAGDVTATLPASPSNGDTYIIGDALGNAAIGTNDIIVDGNGHNIQSIATDTISQAWKWREYTYDSTNSIWHIISNQ